MKTYQMKLANAPFEKIASGRKIIESRLFDEKRQQINVDDRIEFSSSDDPSKKVLTKVKALYRYGSFEDLFSDFSCEYFGGISIEGLRKEIRKFYSVEEEKRYGVVGIKVELVK